MWSEFPLGPIAAYHATGNEESDLSDLRVELPSYDTPGPSRPYRHASRERQLHEFSLENADKHQWATVRFQSWAPSARSLPIFFEDQDITGQVDLDLRQPESIKSIEVSIKGIVRAGHSETNFFHISETLWKNSFGDPRSSDEQGRAKHTGKLIGVYSWSFSIRLPHEIPIEPKLAKELKLNRIEHLPPSLHGLGWNSLINYRLTVNIRKQGIFRSVNSISTLIGYTPTTRPDPPSTARRRAYRERTPIPGPIFDPSGWLILRDIRLTGILFKQREVTVTYTLALATPLAYTRGTVIPCHLTVRSSDRQALDLLASPSAPRVTLRRKLTARKVLMPTERVDLTALEKDDARPLAKAIWAPSERSGNECRLMGELSIPAGCPPSFKFGELNLEYFVDIHTPCPPGFQPSGDHLLNSTPVQVVSAYAEGSSRPRAYITPAHDASRRVAQADALAGNLAALSLERTASESESHRTGFTSRPGTSSGAPTGSLARFDTQGEVQDVIRSVSPILPAGRRLNRRFSAL
ncbi:uncharacterized protein FOMMEDRAFT_141671 [Fomitiporia mediterranea MF3/22]|uniref:uncharacterized protein n=1 Tax=Fomitiporia mediterranea (strain MF3/22) TaxID=694068 RepID=UPI00044093B4|nr:uncharacterized protein FOMMEDRAFT_141671 [Fomitiporia mediterranea MF3/22]EJD00901.1 hypothetical protein FOMMEDRAFT_141671 [Fomitiporia mediterranea MF3/22]